jgi:hypothetical protein
MAAETQQQMPIRRAGAPARASQSGSSSTRANSTGATSGDDGDERRRNQQITMVRRESARRRSECPTRWRQRPSELAGIERRSRRRLTVAREGERWGLGLGSKRVRERRCGRLGRAGLV